MKLTTFRYLTLPDVLNFLVAAKLIRYRIDANTRQLTCQAEARTLLIAKIFNMEVFLKSDPI